MPPSSGCPNKGTPSSEVTGSICRVPSTSFAHSPTYALRIHLCRFRVRSLCQGYFLEVLRCLQNPIITNNLRPSSPLTGQGILTLFPSTTTFVLALGADSPCADHPCAGTLRFSVGMVLTCLIVTYVSILTSDTSSKPHDLPSAAYRTLRYRILRCPRLRYTV